jgi:type I restriction enzyme R subunit
VAGALVDLKEEIPKLRNAHTRVLKHFKDFDLDDVDECILSLEGETRRQDFQAEFRKFSKQMDIILPDPGATPFMQDLKRLGKISIGAKNMFRDEQLDVSGAGEKVRQLIEEHVYSTGIDPKIPPVDLLASDFKERLNDHKSSKAKASEIEHAIKHHIKVKIDDDPEYYKSLSERLEDIIKKKEDKWDELVQLLMDFRGSIEENRERQAEDLGLSDTEFAFHNILMSELSNAMGVESVDQGTHDSVKEVVRRLVSMMDEASQIVDFFNKWDEQKRVRVQIKRAIMDSFDESMVKPVTERFMELAKVKFK